MYRAVIMSLVMLAPVLRAAQSSELDFEKLASRIHASKDDNALGATLLINQMAKSPLEPRAHPTDRCAGISNCCCAIWKISSRKIPRRKVTASTPTTCSTSPPMSPRACASH